jgi:hypothetical protein
MTDPNLIREFIIRGEPRQFIPIDQFREMYRLEGDFGIALFQPKDYRGLGTIEGAGAALRYVHETMIAAIPVHSPPAGWTAFTLELQIRFRLLLSEINGQVGLKNSEMDYAVVNFGAICQAYLNSLMSSRMRGKPVPNFADIYQSWLNKSIEISLPYSYPYRDIHWQVEIVRHAYGRCGLIIEIGTATHYIYDAGLSCPAERFMESLSRAIADRVLAAFPGHNHD